MKSNILNTKSLTIYNRKKKSQIKYIKEREKQKKRKAEKSRVEHNHKVENHQVYFF
jgi:hypothetical protein